MTRVFKIKAGKYNISDVEDSEQTASVEAIFMHENYTGVFKWVYLFIYLFKLNELFRFFNVYI